MNAALSKNVESQNPVLWPAALSALLRNGFSKVNYPPDKSSPNNRSDSLLT